MRTRIDQLYWRKRELLWCIWLRWSDVIILLSFMCTINCCENFRIQIICIICVISRIGQSEHCWCNIAGSKQDFIFCNFAINGLIDNLGSEGISVMQSWPKIGGYCPLSNTAKVSSLLRLERWSAPPHESTSERRLFDVPSGIGRHRVPWISVWQCESNNAVVWHPITDFLRSQQPFSCRTCRGCCGDIHSTKSRDIPHVRFERRCARHFASWDCYKMDRLPAPIQVPWFGGACFVDRRTKDDPSHEILSKHDGNAPSNRQRRCYGGYKSGCYCPMMMRTRILQRRSWWCVCFCEVNEFWV